MSQPLSIENPEEISFITTRTTESRLLLINNKNLERSILGALARYTNRYGAILYGFILMGNHYHLIAKFPNQNRALFMRDFNSATARIIGRTTNTQGRRSVWGRRYSKQAFAKGRNQDVKHWFYYLTCNPISSGIVPNIHQYPSYNSFYDVLNETTKTYKWIDWNKFNQTKKYNPNVKLDEFTHFYKLKYRRLPGHEDLSKEEYKKKLLQLLQERTLKIQQERKEKGKTGFMGVAKIKEQQVGARPMSTKTSTRNSKRPLVLTLSSTVRKSWLRGYFRLRKKFKRISIIFRSLREVNFKISFPMGTYPPPRLKCHAIICDS